MRLGTVVANAIIKDGLPTKMVRVVMNGPDVENEDKA